MGSGGRKLGTNLTKKVLVTLRIKRRKSSDRAVKTSEQRICEKSEHMDQVDSFTHALAYISRPSEFKPTAMASAEAAANRHGILPEAVVIERASSGYGLIDELSTKTNLPIVPGHQARLTAHVLGSRHSWTDYRL